mmetsp:Transcript_22705/g.69387  ORF Transcript_22705/g.69387 Transcript_22705/m.69387 type:complete len:205 (-) Transcript_22705:345-959(-)
MPMHLLSRYRILVRGWNKMRVSWVTVLSAHLHERTIGEVKFKSTLSSSECLHIAPKVAVCRHERNRKSSSSGAGEIGFGAMDEHRVMHRHHARVEVEVDSSFHHFFSKRLGKNRNANCRFAIWPVTIDGGVLERPGVASWNHLQASVLTATAIDCDPHSACVEGLDRPIHPILMPRHSSPFARRLGKELARPQNYVVGPEAMRR